MQSEVENIVIRLAAEQAAVPVSDVSPATHFVNDLNFDSLDVVEFAMKIEDQLHVSVPDEKLTQMHTVGAVIECVRAQVQAEVH